MITQMKSTREAYGEVLVELGKINKDIVVLDADVSKATKTHKFAEKFPERFFNVGCAEANMIDTAAGLSLTGKIPFVSTFAVFATCRVFDQIRNSICYPKLNVKIVGTHSGITVGEDGPTHQAIEDIAIMRAIPNMTVVVPADAIETKKAIIEVAKFQGPVYVRLGRAEVPIVTNENYIFKIGKSEILVKGKDVAIIACGIMVAFALESAEHLEQEGIKVGVINMSTIKPIDKEIIIRSSYETKAIVVAEEHSIIGGLGSAIAEVTAQNYPVPLEYIGIKDTFCESGKPSELLKKYGLIANEISKAVKKVLKKKNKL